VKWRNSVPKIKGDRSRDAISFWDRNRIQGNGNQTETAGRDWFCPGELNIYAGLGIGHVQQGVEGQSPHSQTDLKLGAI
jgi:hypothetical protein